MLKLYAWVHSYFKSEEGAAMVEYGILVAGIAVVVMVLVFTLGTQIATFFQDVIDQLT
ncbi:MAG: Flp family type IVb pilin [Thermoleophilia bacterium]